MQNLLTRSSSLRKWLEDKQCQGKSRTRRLSRFSTSSVNDLDDIILFGEDEVLRLAATISKMSTGSDGVDQASRDTAAQSGGQALSDPFPVQGHRIGRSSLSHKDSFGQYDQSSKAMPSAAKQYIHSTPRKSNLAADDREESAGQSISASATTPTRPERKFPQLKSPGASVETLASRQSSREIGTARGSLDVITGTTDVALNSPMTQVHSLPAIMTDEAIQEPSEGNDRRVARKQEEEDSDNVPQSQPLAKSKSAKGVDQQKISASQQAIVVKNGLGQSAATNGSKNQPSPDPTVPPTQPSRPVRSTGSRAIPQLPCAKDMKPAPPPAMYWSKAPVHGNIPRRSFRAHTANLSDEVLWLFGGCDAKGCFHDLYCFDTETMCWSKPKVTGDVPPARRAHSATMVDKRLYIFAGGDGPYYFNDLYIFDTVALRWSKPEVFGQAPSPRRAHTSSYYDGQLIIFGGGNGVGALNDVFSLDIADPDRLEWRKIECRGKLPIGRGYHTSNLVDGKLIVIGGSDGHTSFDDIQILRLDTKVWYEVKTDEIHNRLGHTATQVGSYLFIIGGHDSRSYTPEVLTLNLVNLQWEPRNVCGKKPPGRGYHQSWLRDGRLFVHGGFDGKEIYDDLYYMDLSACAYLPQITSFSVELDDD